MSGLSLADMRRIGAQRNADTASTKPSKTSLFAGLPFVGRRRPVDDTAGVSGQVPESVTPVAALQNASASPASGMTDAAAVQPLRQNLLRHVAAGGAIGAMLGFGATGDPLALLIAALAGAMAGNIVGKRAQVLPADSAKAVALKRQEAPELFDAVEKACSLAQIDGDALRLYVDQSAAVRATVLDGSRLSSSKSHAVHIGLVVLAGVSTRQLETLAAHALVQAIRAHEANPVSATAVAHLGRLRDALTARSNLLRFANLEVLRDTERQALLSWCHALDMHLREADRFTARCAGPKVLVDALLSQALLAALVTQNSTLGLSYGHSLESLKRRSLQEELDGALRLLAKTPRPTPAEVLTGLPMSLLDRLDALDTSCPVPQLPAGSVALGALPDRLVQKLEKRLVAPPKTPKSKADGSGANAGVNTATDQHVNTAGPGRARKAKPSSSLLARLFGRKRAKAADLQIADLSEQPLYQADTLFKHDPGSGLEAYQALVDTHPRWALARLRLAEAQLETGIADCVPNFMACAERLPSALPSILDRLQSALAMVSPLEEEPLRQAVDQLLINADAIARERSEIELDCLVAPTLDDQDIDMLSSLFANTRGLREVWVFAAPCAWMPEVPHHAVLGLAQRMAPDDAQAIAVALAEHAAVSGTVAVHIETGTPRGALGDALASRPSLWRAGHR